MEEKIRVEIPLDLWNDLRKLTHDIVNADSFKRSIPRRSIARRFNELVLYAQITEIEPEKCPICGTRTIDDGYSGKRCQKCRWWSRGQNTHLREVK